MREELRELIDLDMIDQICQNGLTITSTEKNQLHLSEDGDWVVILELPSLRETMRFNVQKLDWIKWTKAYTADEIQALSVVAVDGLAEEESPEEGSTPPEGAAKVEF